MSGRRFLHTTAAQLRMTFRSRVTLFWSLAFPIIFMTLLGILFGRSVNAGDLVLVGGRTQPALTSALRHTKGLTVKTGADAEGARRQVHDGDRDAALVLRRAPGGDGVRATLYVSNTDATQAGVIRSIVAGVVDGYVVRATGKRPAVVLTSRSVDSAGLRYVDFLLPGIIGIAIMTSSVFGLSTILVDWRKRGILRRLKLTPMPLAEFFAARVTASLAVTVMQVVVLLIFGRVAFGIHIAPQAWAAVPIALLGSLAFLAFGFFVGSMVSTPETADAVANSVTTPMMFLSGTFFPVSSLPSVLAGVAHVLPLYYLSSGLRDTAVRGLPVSHVALDIGVLALMTAVLAALSLRTFRWEPTP